MIKTSADVTREYRKRNPEKVRAWVKKWKEANKDLVKEYAKKGREKRKAKLNQPSDEVTK